LTNKKILSKKVTDLSKIGHLKRKNKNYSKEKRRERKQSQQLVNANQYLVNGCGGRERQKKEVSLDRVFFVM
jgi:hypothetical protein